MFTPIGISGAILISALIAFAVTAAPAAIRQESLPSSEQQPATLVKLRPAFTGAGCSQHGWPNYEARCQFDVNRDAGAERIVRVIALR